MGYAVLHLDKASGNEAKMTAHIERTQIPKNADPQRTHLNREMVEFPDGVHNRTDAIQHRINNAGLQRKIGKNQVRAIRIMLTGSHEEMKRMEQSGRLDEWCGDNLDWLRKTFGAENLVSAVLHLDEATPHIHATVVPIVTGERRKAKEKKQQSGKKQYRKKDVNGARLCADDIMTRIKLKSYQDSYAQAMSRYGLQRGIVGSDARHITTQEFYRNAIAQQGNLQDNIGELLKVEDEKRKIVGDLERRELQSRAHIAQADAKKQQTETELSGKLSELSKVKADISKEKLKNSAAEAGSALMDGISSALGTTKVKRQQQEIENLKTESRSQQRQITDLMQTISRERAENVKVTGELKAELNKIYDWLPDTKPLIRIGEYCKTAGFSDDMVKTLLDMKPVYFSGALYSHEYKHSFETKKSEALLEKVPDSSGMFRLLIDKMDIVKWFRQKQKEWLERVGIKIPERKQNRGMKM